MLFKDIFNLNFLIMIIISFILFFILLGWALSILVIIYYTLTFSRNQLDQDIKVILVSLSVFTIVISIFWRYNGDIQNECLAAQDFEKIYEKYLDTPEKEFWFKESRVFTDSYCNTHRFIEEYKNSTYDLMDGYDDEINTEDIIIGCKMRIDRIEWTCSCENKILNKFFSIISNDTCTKCAQYKDEEPEECSVEQF